MTRRGGGRRGLVLLEAALAIVIFVVAGGVILAMLSDGLAAQQRAREQQRLVDLARSAMALIEAGAATPETLNGPVKGWVGAAPGDAEPGQGMWELGVQTQPWGSEGLVLVSVQAKRVGATGTGYTLRQLVRMSRASTTASAPTGGAQ